MDDGFGIWIDSCPCFLQFHVFNVNFVEGCISETSRCPEGMVIAWLYLHSRSFICATYLTLETVK